MENQQHYNQHYKGRSIRMADKTWERLKEKKEGSNKSWNLYFLDLLKHYKQSKNKMSLSEKNSSSRGHPQRPYRS